MSVKQHIPNFITLLNLLSGIVAVLFAAVNQLELAAYFVFIGIFFDFLDGLAARLLKVQGELGKQLDSLADMITSGVVPGIVIFQLLRQSTGQLTESIWFSTLDSLEWLPFIGLLIPLAAAYRLANFNLDERQTTLFIGLPTPAMSLFVLSLPLILLYSDNELIKPLILNKYFLIVITLVLSFLMNADLKLFSLKIKNFSLKNNRIQFLFLLLSIVVIILLKFVAVPVIILLYILLSVINNLRK